MADQDTGGSGDIEVVARATNMIEARVITGLLESSGIPARIRNEEVLTLYDGAASIWEQGIPVEVSSEHAAEAKEILALHRDAAAAADSDSESGEEE